MAPIIRSSRRPERPRRARPAHPRPARCLAHEHDARGRIAVGKDQAGGGALQRAPFKRFHDGAQFLQRRRATGHLPRCHLGLIRRMGGKTGKVRAADAGRGGGRSWPLGLDGGRGHLRARGRGRGRATRGRFRARLRCGGEAVYGRFFKRHVHPASRWKARASLRLKWSEIMHPADERRMIGHCDAGRERAVALRLRKRIVMRRQPWKKSRQTLQV